jgi:hypothetical protein
MAIYWRPRHRHRSSPICHLALPSMGHPNVPRLQVYRRSRLRLPPPVRVNPLPPKHVTKLTFLPGQRHRHRRHQAILPQVRVRFR